MIHEGTFIYVKKWKMAALAVFISAIIVTLLFICIHSADHPGDQGFFIALSVLVIPFFGIYLVYAVSALFWNSPGLIIDSEGIYDNTSIAGAGMVRWEDIKEIYFQRFKRGQGLVYVVTRDGNAILSRQKLFKRVLLKLQVGSVRGDTIIIDCGLLDTSLEEVVQQIRKYYEVKRGKPKRKNFR